MLIIVLFLLKATIFSFFLLFSINICLYIYKNITFATILNIVDMMFLIYIYLFNSSVSLTLSQNCYSFNL